MLKHEYLPNVTHVKQITNNTEKSQILLNRTFFI